MARTIKEIYNAIISEKQTFSSLDGLLPTTTPSNAFDELLAELSSVSKVAVWRLLAYIIAVAHHFHEKYWDYAKQELETIAEQSIAGNKQWYMDQVKKWQFGFLLSWNNVTYRYFYSDTTSAAAVASRLAAKVAIVEVFSADYSGIIVKIAKLNGSTLAPLTQSELDSAQAYVDRIKFAGVQSDVISQPADILKLTLKVFYDGTISDSAMQVSVNDAVQEYIGNLDFDGRFYIIRLIDKIQEIKGVNDVSVVSAMGKSYVGSYAAFTNHYDSESGWLTIDPVSVFELIKI